MRSCFRLRKNRHKKKENSLQITTTIMEDCGKSYELLGSFWKWRLQSSPEFATFCGIHTFDDKLESYATEAIQEKKAACVSFLKQAEELCLEELTEISRENINFLIDELKSFLKGWDAKGYLFPLNYLEGPQIEFERLIEAMKFEAIEDYNKLLSRYKELPVQISQIIDVMRAGIKQNMTFHKMSVAGIPGQIDLLDQLDLLQENPQMCVFYKPFLSLSKSDGSEQKEGILLEAVDSITHNVLPAFKMLKHFLENEYFNHLRPDIAVSSLPDGTQFYQMCLDFHISYRMPPKKVHEIGLAEVERIKKEMEKVIESLKLNMSVKEFSQKIREDKSFCFKNEKDLLSAYKKLVFKTIQPKLKNVFKSMPESELEIRPFPPSMFGGPAAYYYAGSISGNPGVFYVNVGNLKSAHKYEMVALALHEGIPGHHLQSSYLMENKELHPFRQFLEDRKYSEAPSRFPLHTTFLEGWGLYCEYLGHELGLYSDPYDHFGRLSMEIFRAARLVVDTGIHVFGWTYERAVDYMLENSALSKSHIEEEVKRYITIPGQACAYKIGEMKIKSLREMAETKLGPKFNLKEFHDIVLRNCGPLNILEKKVRVYIKENI